MKKTSRILNLALLGCAMATIATTGSRAATINLISGSVTGTESTRWRTATTTKTMDLDGDNVYGTMGAVIWGDGANVTKLTSQSTYAATGLSTGSTFGWQIVNQTVSADIGIGLQNFQHAGYADVDNLAGGTTGAPGLSSIADNTGTITIQMNGTAAEYLGATVRLGIMQDYQENTAVNNINKRYDLVQTFGGGGSATFTATTMDLAPDFYFFDISGINPGDQFTLTAFRNPATAGQGGLASIPILSLDKVPEPSVGLLSALALGLLCRRNRRL